MAAIDRQAFVADLEKRHGTRLRRFLAARLRRVTDVEDLVQEVFLRLLRLGRHPEEIRSSESYLFVVALNVLHRHLSQRSAAPQPVDISALAQEIEAAPHSDPLAQAEMHQQLKDLQGALRQLPEKAQAVLLLHRRDGYSLGEIATQLGFSRANAAKYLSKALLHCRQRLQDTR